MVDLSGIGGMAQPEGVVRFIREASSAHADAPDADLVEGFAVNRDERAFRALVTRYGPLVWSVCRKLLRNHHDAEDAFQATFLVLARKARDLRAGAAVGSWLHAVAYRVAVRVRSARRSELASPEPATGAPSALDEMTVREAGAALHEELARLPEKYRAPIVLCGLEGLSRDEAAHRLTWTANQVKHGLERGREVLRTRLARRGIALGLPLLVNLLGTPAGAVPVPLIEASTRYATGTVPPAALLSLVRGVTRTMLLSKWKWTVVGCVVLALVASGTLAGRSRGTASDAPPIAKTGSTPVSPALPKVRPEEPKKEPPIPALDVASSYLSFIASGRPDAALKLGNNLDRYVKELQTAGLGSAKIVAVLFNDSRVMIVTERLKLKRSPNAEATDEHVTVTVERKDRASPWLVRESDIADETKVLREVGEYLANKFALPPSDPPKEEADDPKYSWVVASKFLTHSLNENVDEALKLTVPGNISETKVEDIKKAGPLSTKPTAILTNQTRIEVAFACEPPGKPGAPPEPGPKYLVVTLALKEGTWQVKDIDLRDGKKLEPRVVLYLGGRYDEKPEKK